MINKAKQFFEFSKHNTDFKTECIAGISTFLSLAYIFVVNPAILSEGGINKSSALFATVIISALATIAMGLWAKKPFALAPGLEINSYVVYFLILGLGISWQNSLGLVFWSGIIFLGLTITNIRTRLIEAIPDNLKLGLAATIGIFLILIALRLSDILTYDKSMFPRVGSPFTYKGLILILGLTIVVGLELDKSRYFILISIVICSLIAHATGLTNPPANEVTIHKNMFDTLGQLNLGVILSPKFISPMIILFVLDFYGSIAKFIGLTRNTTIQENGKFPKMKEALLIDGAATSIGAVIGTTSIVAFVESGVGISAGGRTGLTAVVCGICMLLFIPLAPIINLVPVVATTGVICWVGIKIIRLLPRFNQISTYPLTDQIAIGLMIVVTLLTFSLDKAMLAGFIAYVIGLAFTGRLKQLNFYFLVSIALIFMSWLLSAFYV